MSALALATTPALAQMDVNYGVQPDTDPSFIAKAWATLTDRYQRSGLFKEFAYGAPENQAMAAGALQFASARHGAGDHRGLAPAGQARRHQYPRADRHPRAWAVSATKSACELKGKAVAYPGEGL